MCGELITETLVNEIKDANFFTVLADEATDCSNVEEIMAIVLRFIDNFFKVREEFLGFITCRNGLSGEALSTEIKILFEALVSVWKNVADKAMKEREIWQVNYLGSLLESCSNRIKQYTSTVVHTS